MIYAPYTEDVFTPREVRITNELADYIVELTERAPGKIMFRTGAGRVERDLLLHWPIIENREIEAQLLVKKIAEAVFPLLGTLYAQGVELVVIISQDGIEPPKHVEKLSSYVIFDPIQMVERTMFLSPQHDIPPSNALRAGRGIAVQSTPINYRYHTLKDDRIRKAHIRVGMFELPQRMINEMYEQPPYIAKERRILDAINAKVSGMPRTLERYEQSREANLQGISGPQQKLPAQTALSALPPPVRALERQIMANAMDTSLSSDFRMGLRRVAQSIRGVYPQASIEEAARFETVAPGVTPGARFTSPAATPQMQFYLPVSENTEGIVPEKMISPGRGQGVAGSGFMAEHPHETITPRLELERIQYPPPPNLPTARYPRPAQLPIARYPGPVRYPPVPQYAPAAGAFTAAAVGPPSPAPGVQPTGGAAPPPGEPLGRLAGEAPVPGPPASLPARLAAAPVIYTGMPVPPEGGTIGPPYYVSSTYLPPEYRPTARYAGPLEYQPTGEMPVPRYVEPGTLPTPQYALAGALPTAQYPGPPVLTNAEYLTPAILPTLRYQPTPELPTAKYPGSPVLTSAEYLTPAILPTLRYQPTPELPTATYAPAAEMPTPTYAPAGGIATPGYAPTPAFPTAGYAGPPVMPSGGAPPPPEEAGPTEGAPSGPAGGTFAPGYSPAAAYFGPATLPSGVEAPSPETIGPSELPTPEYTPGGATYAPSSAGAPQAPYGPGPLPTPEYAAPPTMPTTKMPPPESERVSPYVGPTAVPPTQFQTGPAISGEVAGPLPPYEGPPAPTEPGPPEFVPPEPTAPAPEEEFEELGYDFDTRPIPPTPQAGTEYLYHAMGGGLEPPSLTPPEIVGESIIPGGTKLAPNMPIEMTETPGEPLKFRGPTLEEMAQEGAPLKPPIPEPPPPEPERLRPFAGPAEAPPVQFQGAPAAGEEAEPLPRSEGPPTPKEEAAPEFVPPTPATPSAPEEGRERLDYDFDIEPIPPRPEAGTEYLYHAMLGGREPPSTTPPEIVGESIIPGGRKLAPDMPLEMTETPGEPLKFRGPTLEEIVTPPPPKPAETGPEVLRPEEIEQRQEQGPQPRAEQPERREEQPKPEQELRDEPSPKQEQWKPEEKQEMLFAPPVLSQKPVGADGETPMPLPQPRTTLEHRTSQTYIELKETPSNFPKAVLVGASGRLENKSRAELVRNAPKPHTFDRTNKPKSWAFPTPGLEPFPRTPSGRRKNS